MIARGRLAWILALVFGGLLGIIGVAIGATKGWSWNAGMGGWLVGVGAAFALFGGIFLGLSYASGGRTD